MEHEPRFGDVVTFVRGASEIRGVAAESYGQVGDRKVVLGLEPEPSEFGVDEPTTLSLDSSRNQRVKVAYGPDASKAACGFASRASRRLTTPVRALGP